MRIWITARESPFNVFYDTQLALGSFSPPCPSNVPFPSHRRDNQPVLRQGLGRRIVYCDFSL